MKTLILTRHAKSDWTGDTPSDHERRLSKRGHRTAPLIGRWLRGKALIPDLILCSDAVRTRETLALILAEWETWPTVRQRRSLYNASDARMLEIVKAETTAECIMIVAHNPGIGALAERLLARPAAHPRFGPYPTGATAAITFELDDWAKLQPGSGVLAGFTIPADLG